MKVWFNGRITAIEDARVSCLAHTIHYGTGVFEGIRSYCVDDGHAIFKLKEHVARLFTSAKALKIHIPFSTEELELAIDMVLLANDLSDAYIRPLVFFERGGMGLGVNTEPLNPVMILIAAWRWDSYFATIEWEKGISVQLANWKRVFAHPSLSNVKAVGFYANSYIAHANAQSAGFSDAILVDEKGNLAEASAANIFFVQKETLFTPAEGAILPGITRGTVIDIARELGLRISEEEIFHERIFLADEVFFTGTACEITPVTKINKKTIGTGRAGRVTKQISSAYQQLVRNGRQVPQRQLVC